MAAAHRNLALSGRIVRTMNEGDLEQVAEPDVQAVIFIPEVLPDYFRPLTAAVESGAFRVSRTILSDVGRSAIGSWLEANLPRDAVAPQVRLALLEDILALPNRIAALAAVQRLQLRMFTAAPTCDCGFHVDTVPPAAPNVGLLRVYNGAGTSYIEPSNVTSMREFYAYLSRRENLERKRKLARMSSDEEQNLRLEDELAKLDLELSFLKSASEIHTVPAGSIVAFRHLDVRLHWTDHSPSLAWIHCSPMHGERRLVVNFAAGRVTRPVPNVSR